MNPLISLLLREGIGAYGGRLLRQSLRRLGGLVAFYAVIALLAIATLAFLYVLIYRWLAETRGDEAAAAIVCGANLGVIALLLIVHRLSSRRSARRPPAKHLDNIGFDTGVALGLNLSRRLRKAAPQVALIAAVLGVIIGARPELLTLFRRKGGDKPQKKS